MRWTKKKKIKRFPISGDTRHRSAFLWTPVKIGAETRWLEWASWREQYWSTRIGSGWVKYYWLD